MSVYTKITRNECENLLHDYGLSTLIDFAGIEEGVTNTIYCVQTSNARYILTLFETLKATQLPFYLNLMNYLAIECYLTASRLLQV